MIWTTFFSLFIWPIQALIQVFFVFFMKAFSGDPGLTIVAISLVVNTLVLPIYLVADRWQAEERGLLDRMRSKVAQIRAVFRGDERQMILGTYYRQMGYHPLFSIRSSVGLLIQIPFFLAAYDFLSHSPALQGARFLFLADLGRPDGLLVLGGLSINVLPFVMTALNLASAFLYTKGLGTREKVQLFVLAALFLVLLYASPSGLVLYWTVSNLFSLGKNAAMGLKRPGRAFHVVLVVATAAAVMVPASGLFGAVSVKMLAVGAGLATVVALVPWCWKALVRWFGRTEAFAETPGDFRIVVLASTCLALLTGLVIPSLLVASSPTEFHQVWSLLFQTLLQSVSLFLLVPLAAWALSGPDLRRLLPPLSVALTVLAVVNAFVLPGKGTLTESFQFTLIDDTGSKWDPLTTSAEVILVAGGVLLLWRLGKRAWVTVGLSLLASVFVVLVAIELVSVDHGGRPPVRRDNQAVQPVFHLSKTHQNLFVVFLDRAAGAAFPRALELSPALRDELDGFVWYPDTMSYAWNTILGSPALFGGYEYTPDAMNARTDATAVSKVNEALKVLPKVFGEAGYRVTFTDPAYANFGFNPPDVSVFRGMKNVTALNIKGDNRKLYLKELHLDQDQLPEQQRFEYDILERFSIYRIAPPYFRFPLYRNGSWWNANQTDVSFNIIMDSLSNLHYLPELTVVDSDQPTLNIMENEATHDTGAVGPDLKVTPWQITVPQADLDRFGEEPDAKYVYNYAASFVELAAWFRSLKAHGVWDNTKIILIADHGVSFTCSEFPDRDFARFNPLLMIKDFGANGTMRTDSTFMTNADLPALLAQSLGGAANPWSGKPLTLDGKNGPKFAHVGPSWPSDLTATTLAIEHTWQLTKPSVFAQDGWKKIK